MYLLDRDGRSSPSCSNASASTTPPSPRRYAACRTPAWSSASLPHMTGASWWSTSPTRAVPCASPSRPCGRPWRPPPRMSEQQAESFVETTYAITEAISSRALPEEESRRDSPVCTPCPPTPGGSPPAYTGRTPPRMGVVAPHPAHPRLRGEDRAGRMRSSSSRHLTIPRSEPADQRALHTERRLSVVGVLPAGGGESLLFLIPESDVDVS